ncbi:hypothetical protein AB4K20DRAFT_1900772 [Rhizopus microsporus]
MTEHSAPFLSMGVISKEQAICMFYYEPYNEPNVIKLSKLIDGMYDIEIFVVSTLLFSA